MTADIIDMLEQEEIPDNIQKLLDDCVRMVNHARGEISKNYSEWDKALATYQRKTSDDASDLRAKQKKEPAKMVVPLTYAQVQTLVTFLYIAFTGKESVFELAATGDEDYPIREVSQAIIDREIRQTNFHMKLVPALLDMARFRYGVLKTSWQYESIFLPPSEEVDVSFLFNPDGTSLPSETKTEEKEVILKEGCKIENISPFHWFYDTRVPFPSWRDGRFTADEQCINLKDLQRAEKQGQFVGVDFIEPFDATTWSKRGGSDSNRFSSISPDSLLTSERDRKDRMCCVTQVQLRLTPSDYELNDSDEETIWLVTYVNDTRIVSIIPLNAPYHEFQYDVLEMMPDQHASLSDSLSKVIDPIQEVITWLINARVASVRRNIDGRLVVDPQYVDTSTLTTSSAFIMLKKNAPHMGIDKLITQLRTTDPTASHFNDVDSLMRLLQLVSGVNENSMGSFSPGRRSATENRTANAGAASRMKLIAASCWHGGLAPLGRKLLLSCRQDLSLESFTKIVGQRKADEFYALFHPENPWELYGNEDFFNFDSTIESERNYVAQSLQELVVALMSNPEMAMTMNLDLPKMVREIQALRGVKNLSRFELPVQPQPTLPQPSLAPTLPLPQ